MPPREPTVLDPFRRGASRAERLNGDAVVVQGEWKHTYGDAADAAPLPAGSHWHQTGKQVHGDGCASASGECIVLVSYPRGKRDFIPAAKK